MTKIEKRRKYISDVVAREGSANVAALAERLGVTQATIRTDLRSLEKSGVLKRSHGGAIALSRAVRDMGEEEKAGINPHLKRRIAKRASGMVEKDDSIIIAPGSTMTCFAENLIPDGSVNVITPSVRVAMTLINTEGVNVFQLGGVIYGNSLSTRGEYAQAGLKYLHAAKMFFGAEGFDPQFGITCATLEEAELTREMMKNSSQIILLADSTKFCRRGFAKICDLSDIDILVTDSGISEVTAKKIEEQGVEVVIAL